LNCVLPQHIQIVCVKLFHCVILGLNYNCTDDLEGTHSSLPNTRYKNGRQRQTQRPGADPELTGREETAERGPGC